MDLQSQSQSNTTPKTIQLPPQPKGRPEGNGHSNDIIAKQVHPASDLLSSETSEQTIAVCGEGIEELERRAEGQNRGNEINDTLIIGEELGYVVAEGGEEDDVEDANDCGGEHCLFLVSG